MPHLPPGLPLPIIITVIAVHLRVIMAAVSPLGEIVVRPDTGTTGHLDALRVAEALLDTAVALPALPVPEDAMTLAVPAVLIANPRIHKNSFTPSNLLCYSL